jgi:hypothetical protein
MLSSRWSPLPLERLRERFLPERTFRGRQNTKLQYTVLAAPALQGGTEPDLVDEVSWWQTPDLWQHALFAAVAHIRAAASRAGVPVRQACQDLARRPGHAAPQRPLRDAAEALSDGGPADHNGGSRALACGLAGAWGVARGGCHQPHPAAFGCQAGGC